MGSLSRHDITRILGHIRWDESVPSLLGRKLTVGMGIRVLVELAKGADDGGTWLDAEISSISASGVELRTSFARFRVEPTALCRWPDAASTLTRRELASCFAGTTLEVNADLRRLVTLFETDPQLRKVPQEQLSAYSVAIAECGEKIAALAALMASVAQDLSAAADGSLLVVGQLIEPSVPRARVK